MYVYLRIQIEPIYNYNNAIVNTIDTKLSNLSKSLHNICKPNFNTAYIIDTQMQLTTIIHTYITYIRITIIISQILLLIQGK